MEEKKSIGEQESEKNQRQAEAPTLISEAVDAAKRLEEANKARGELLAREEALAARQMLGGRSIGASQEISKLDRLKEELKPMMNDNSLNPFKGRGAKALEMDVHIGDDGLYLR